MSMNIRVKDLRPYLEALCLSCLHKCPCSCSGHHLLASTSEIITVFGLVFLPFFGIIQKLLLSSHFPWAHSICAWISSWYACRRRTRLQPCNKFLSLSSLHSAENNNFHQRGCFKGHQVSREDYSPERWDRGYVTLLRHLLKSFTPPFWRIYMWQAAVCSIWSECDAEAASVSSKTTVKGTQGPTSLQKNVEDKKLWIILQCFHFPLHSAVVHLAAKQTKHPKKKSFVIFFYENICFCVPKPAYSFHFI